MKFNCERITILHISSGVANFIQNICSNIVNDLSKSFNFPVDKVFLTGCYYCFNYGSFFLTSVQVFLSLAYSLPYKKFHWKNEELPKLKQKWISNEEDGNHKMYLFNLTQLMYIKMDLNIIYFYILQRSFKYKPEFC